jgi:hypothetical protein
MGADHQHIIAGSHELYGGVRTVKRLLARRLEHRRLSPSYSLWKIENFRNPLTLQKTACRNGFLPIWLAWGQQK